MKEAILIRHGMTEGNIRNLYYGSTDLPLSPQGEAALRELRRKGGYPSMEGFRYFVTPLRRTEQSLRALIGDVPFEIIPELREISFGIFEMHSYEEMKDWPEYQMWISGDYMRNVPPGGESFEQLFRRAYTAFREVMASCDKAVLLIHGGPISAIMATLFPPEDKNFYRYIPDCGKGFYICEKDGIMTCKPIPEVTT